MAASGTVEATCLVDMEQTHDSLHAHAVPVGVEVQPGDVVLVHDAPSYVPFGEKLTKQCRATVLRAGPIGRMKARLGGLLLLTDLYEVGFMPKDI